MADPLGTKLRKSLADTFDQTNVLVWRDPSGVLGPLLRLCLPDGVEMPPFEGNPLNLRAAVDLADAWVERKWLLYVPSLPDDAPSDWLADYEEGFRSEREKTMSGVLQEHFGVRETPSLREALKGPAAVRLALDFGKYFPKGAVSDEADVLFALLRAAISEPAAEPADLVLRYLTSDQDLERWQALGLLPQLTAAIKSKLGLSRHLTDGHAPDRGALCRCMVASALVELKAVEPKPLSNHLPSADCRPLWKAALDEGLRHPDLAPALLGAIRESLRSSDLLNAMGDDPVQIAKGPALWLIDQRILTLLREKMPAAAPQEHAWWTDIQSVAGDRLKQPYLDDPTRQLWLALRTAAELRFRVRQRLEELTRYPVSCFARLASEYVASDGDWIIDKLHRELPPEGQLPAIGEWDALLLAPARQDYFKWTRAVAEKFTSAFEAGGAYSAPDFVRQTEFWSRFVGDAPRTAVLFVDALRADLARALEFRMAKRRRPVETLSVLAQLPTRTEVGMAALLPRADSGFAVRVEDGALIPYIESRRLYDTTARYRYLDDGIAAGGRTITRAEIDDFLAYGGKRLRDCAAHNELPVALTTEIDDGGPQAAKVALSQLDASLEKCERFIDTALTLGFEQVLVAGDHGFILREPGGASVGIPGTADAAGGLARGLRYAAGKGQIAPNLLRVPAAALERGGADVFVPRDTSYLATKGGAGLFLHGGLSPQECVLLFLRVRRGDQPAELPVCLVVDRRVTSLALKVVISAAPVKEPLLHAMADLTLRVLGAAGKLVHEEASVRLRPAADRGEHLARTIMLPGAGRYDIVLLDTRTGLPRDTASVDVEILGGEFDFS